MSNEHDYDPDDLVSDVFDAEPVRQRPRHLAARAVSARRVVGGRMSAASAALSVGVVGVVVATFLVIQSFFPWMTLFNDDDKGIEKADKPISAIRTVSDPGPTPAETVVEQVIETRLPAFDGWDASRTTSSIGAASFGFGCDPTDGLSAVTARTRSWVTESGSAAVTLSARVYPAGGGAVALEGISAASLACEAAWVDYVSVDLGVEAVQVESSRIAALVWRRGDVVMIATVTAAGNAGNPGTYAEALRRADDTLADELVGVCVDPEAGALAAVRSPYLDRAAYDGHYRTETVDRPSYPNQRTAEQRTTNPVVPFPAPEQEIPFLGDLPETPYPAPTSTVSTLPPSPAYPTEPTEPTKPVLTAKIDRSVEDTVGPGCGWEFTAQAVPTFDETSATAKFDRAATKAKKRLTREWRSWQDAKVAFYAAYAAYLDDIESYRAYAEEVEEIRAAWAKIDAARARYYTAYANWEIEVQAREDFIAASASARAEYQAAQEACREQRENPPEPTPTTPPSPGATPTGPTEPQEPEEPEMVCPPVRPDILSEPTPTVGPQPTPGPKAQLP